MISSDQYICIYIYICKYISFYGLKFGIDNYNLFAYFDIHIDIYICTYI